MDGTNPYGAIMRRFFTTGLTAHDITEPLISFDVDRPAEDIRKIARRERFDFIGVRTDGRPHGFATTAELTDGAVGDHLRPFSEAMVMDEATSLHLIVCSLDDWPCVFITSLGSVGGVVTRTDMEKPIARMWLFGLVTTIEMGFARMLEQYHPRDSWKPILPESRLARASALRTERRRNGQKLPLTECLHFADKGHIVAATPEAREQLGFESRRAAKRAFGLVESLRNSLAHANPIVENHWETILLFSHRMDAILGRLEAGPRG